jgi:hypothetical protein
MKYSILATWILLFALISAQGQTPGTLSVSASTSSTGGNYAPKNIVAIWVEDEQGNFVKTLLAYAQTRKTHLNTWEASTTAAGSPFNTVDAITGATKTSHATRTCTWDATDVNGNIVPDGTYRLRMELTDKNGTGNFSTFTFSKDTLPVNLTPANVPSFSSISINWEPVITFVDEIESGTNYVVFPNPTTGVFQIGGVLIDESVIFNASGKKIMRSVSNSIDLSNYPDGIYYIRFTTGQGPITKKIVKNTHVR